MSSLVISLVVLACILGAAALPGHYLYTELRDSLKVVIGIS